MNSFYHLPSNNLPLYTHCSCAPAWLTNYSIELTKIVLRQNPILLCAHCFDHGVKEIILPGSKGCYISWKCYKNNDDYHCFPVGWCDTCFNYFSTIQNEPERKNNETCRFIRFVVISDDKFLEKAFSSNVVAYKILIALATQPSSRHGGSVMCANISCGARELEAEVKKFDRQFLCCSRCLFAGQSLGTDYRVYYCQKACQREHYPQHKKICRMRLKIVVCKKGLKLPTQNLPPKHIVTSKMDELD
jgi:hypothetical protein